MGFKGQAVEGFKAAADKFASDLALLPFTDEERQQFALEALDYAGDALARYAFPDRIAEPVDDAALDPPTEEPENAPEVEHDPAPLDPPVDEKPAEDIAAADDATET